MQQQPERTHLVWVDVIRLVAIFLVVCCHCCDPFNLNDAARSDPGYGFWGALYGSLLRPCVPLFAMMTGLLLLPVREESAAGFYRRRIVRVAVPLVIWSVLYNIFPALVGSLGGGTDTVAAFFPYSAAYGSVPSLEWGEALRNIALVPFNFSVYDVHMWYLYMLIGLYLFMPVLSAWLERCSRRDLNLMLVLWGVTLLLPYVVQYVGSNFWGVCSWNSFGMLYYFAGFNGYLVLGYYLKNYNRLSSVRRWSIAVPLFVAGFAITFVGFRHIALDPSSSEQMIELFWTYCSVNVAMMTAAVFMVMQNIKIGSQRWRSWLSKVSRYGLGIYMCHYFFVGVAYMLIDRLGVAVWLQIPVAAVLVMTASWLVTAAVYRLMPRAARWIMG